MQEQYAGLELVNNTEKHFFEMTVDGHTAFIHYKQQPGHIILIHTEVPDAIGGKGVAAAIVEKTLNYIEQHNLRLIPRCEYVISFLRRHPEWNRLVDE